jgi:hypothetical protein
MQCGLATSRADGTGCLEKLVGVVRRRIIANTHEHIKNPCSSETERSNINHINLEYIAVQAHQACMQRCSIGHRSCFGHRAAMKHGGMAYQRHEFLGRVLINRDCSESRADARLAPPPKLTCLDCRSVPQAAHCGQLATASRITAACINTRIGLSTTSSHPAKKRLHVG